MNALVGVSAHPLQDPRPTRILRAKEYITYTIHSVIGLSADSIHILLRTLRILPTRRLVSDYKVRHFLRFRTTG